MESDTTPKSGSVSDSAPKVYSVPRRYDLATLFAISLAYALLFGAMRIFNADPVAFAIVASFVTFVGLAQALLFRGKAPRVASAIAGILYWVIGLIIVSILRGAYPYLSVSRLWILLPGVWVTATAGSVLGYFGGVFVGAVFMFADITRRSVRRFERS